MTPPRLSIALATLLSVVAPGLSAQERATGETTLERRAPPPRGVTVEQGGVPLTGTVAPGQEVEISGANVVVVEDTPRVTRIAVRNDVLFDFDKAELRPEAAEALTRVAEIIRQRRPALSASSGTPIPSAPRATTRRSPNGARAAWSNGFRRTHRACRRCRRAAAARPSPSPPTRSTAATIPKAASGTAVSRSCWSVEACIRGRAGLA